MKFLSNICSAISLLHVVIGQQQPPSTSPVTPLVIPLSQAAGSPGAAAAAAAAAANGLHSLPPVTPLSCAQSSKYTACTNTQSQGIASCNSIVVDTPNIQYYQW